MASKPLAFIAITTLCFSGSSWGWDPVRDLTGKTLREITTDTATTVENSTKKFLHNPVDWIADRPERLIAGVCAAVPNAYEGTLRGQVGTWKSLPAPLIGALQQHYSVNLAGIRYAENISTSNGDAQTFANAIYFPRSINLNERSDLWWMLHELEHSVQFAGSSWGTSGKLCEYMAKGIGRGFDHDSIDMERSANAKANALIDYAHSALSGIAGAPQQSPGQAAPLPPNMIWIRNETPNPVTFYLQTQSASGTVVLPPFSAQMYRGNPTDTSFFISVLSGPTPWRGPVEIRYILSGGTYQHLAWNNYGVLDVFWSN